MASMAVHGDGNLSRISGGRSEGAACGGWSLRELWPVRALTTLT